MKLCGQEENGQMVHRMVHLRIYYGTKSMLSLQICWSSQRKVTT